MVKKTWKLPNQVTTQEWLKRMIEYPWNNMQWLQMMANSVNDSIENVLYTGWNKTSEYNIYSLISTVQKYSQRSKVMCRKKSETGYFTKWTRERYFPFSLINYIIIMINKTFLLPQLYPVLLSLVCLAMGLIIYLASQVRPVSLHRHATRQRETPITQFHYIILSQHINLMGHGFWAPLFFSL